MDTIFTVREEDLERLSPREAVDCFRQLLWAEARKIGIPISSIHISCWINVPDGGVDASVGELAFSLESDLVKAGRTSYQIKAGVTFKPWRDNDIKKELFRTKPVHKENLSSGVRDCLDRNGTYVLVCFKQDPNDEQHRQSLRALEYYFRQCGYENSRAEVWGQSNLLGFLQVFPSLSLKVNHRGGLRFQTHGSWSREAEMTRHFNAGQPQEEFISNMRSGLMESTEAVHLRVWGEPGIGKTRLVLEATRTEDLEPLVIYCDRASEFRDSDLMNEILKEDNRFTAILVIDECDPDSRSYVWDKLKYRGPRIKLISIYNDYDETSGNISYLNVPPLGKAQVSDIIRAYGIAKDQADRWAEDCSGYPRVAHVFGQNLRNNPEDLLKSPDTVEVWNRYVVAGDDPNSQQVQQRWLVLRHLALFKRFGYGRPVVSEAQTIHKMVEQKDPHVTWARFQEIVQDLRRRRILQGENTLYITPKPLHIKLWAEWWDTYGVSFNVREFIQGMTPSLRRWFGEMTIYASESPVASNVVKELLGENGLFQDES